MLWATMNHHDLLWVTMCHYYPKHIHYDPLLPTIKHSELLWCNAFPLWATTSQYGPTFVLYCPKVGKDISLFFYFVKHEGTSFYIKLGSKKYSRILILNSTIVSSNCYAKLPFYGSGTSKFFVAYETWYMQDFRDVNSTFNIFLLSVKNIFFRVNLIPHLKSKLS